MAEKRTYTKKEISKILTKASEIQAAEDLYSDQEGLTENELIHVAKEVGINKQVLLEALQTIDEPDLNEQSYSLIDGTSRIQDVSIVKGEISGEQWEELILDIRKITGGIGKARKAQNTFEWEQRKSDFGYKHFSFTSKNGETKIQMVSSWGALKKLVSFISFFAGFIVALIAFKEISGKQLALMIAPFFGLGGFAMSRFYLKSYFQKQKTQLAKLTNVLSKKIRSFERPSRTIEIEDRDIYRTEKKADSASNRNAYEV